MQQTFILATLIPTPLHINFIISLFISIKTLRFLIGIEIHLCISWEKINIITVLSCLDSITYPNIYLDLYFISSLFCNFWHASLVYVFFNLL